MWQLRILPWGWVWKAIPYWDRCLAPSRCFAPTFSVYPRKRCRTPSEEVSRGCSWCYTYWLLLCHFKGDRNVQRNVIFNLPSLKLLAWTRFNQPLKSTWTRLELDMHTAIITAPIICLESIDKNEPPRQSKRKRELTNARKGYERLMERIWKMKESTLLFQILSDSFRCIQYDQYKINMLGQSRLSRLRCCWHGRTLSLQLALDTSFGEVCNAADPQSAPLQSHENHRLNWLNTIKS